MPGCSCVNTAVIKENENEQLREYIRILEKKIMMYQKTLLNIYSSDSEASDPRNYSQSNAVNAGKMYTRSDSSSARSSVPSPAGSSPTGPSPNVSP